MTFLLQNVSAFHDAQDKPDLLLSLAFHSLGQLYLQVFTLCPGPKASTSLQILPLIPHFSAFFSLLSPLWP